MNIFSYRKKYSIIENERKSSIFFKIYILIINKFYKTYLITKLTFMKRVC